MSAQSTTALLAFYHVTKIEDWTYTNMMNYYQEKTGEKERKKLLHCINKDLEIVKDPDSQFDETRKIKAEEILHNWKEWKSSSKTLDTPLIIRRFQVEQLVTGESATNIVNKHCEIKIARNMTQGIEESGRTTMTNNNMEQVYLRNIVKSYLVDASKDENRQTMPPSQTPENEDLEQNHDDGVDGESVDDSQKVTESMIGKVERTPLVIEMSIQRIFLKSIVMNAKTTSTYAIAI
ncbi:hypothetical protein F8M41_006698 [Gigaspora margarita]|uniref:Uncharacterized protein n=1 Tax=Gigaspora margarita TaxID=4874 RepID=A0A8H3X6T3_GIGMA|nr:hypothetical protein F8M41_006698 [Gigaspora margarita]